MSMRGTTVAVVFFAVVAALVATCLLGVAYAIGASLTAAKSTVLICSAAGLGGLISGFMVIAGADFDQDETVGALWGIFLVAALFGGICAAVLW
jgi:hypothetical protein